MKNTIASVSLALVLALCAGVIGCTGEYVPETRECYLAISSTSGGSVTTPGEGIFAYYSETAVELVARPASGYRFVNWSGDVNCIADVNAASTIIITMNDDYSVVANFEAVWTGQYDLTISSTVGGSVTTPGEGPFSYDDGMGVNLVATPDSGYRFVGWTGTVHTIGDVNAASTTITMNAGYSVVANFEAIPPAQYTLTISSTTGGSVSTPGQGTFRYDAGAVVDLVTESEEGYKFFNWTGDIEMMTSFNGSSSTKHCQPPMRFSITMEGNYSITAHFIPRWFIPTGQGLDYETQVYGAEELTPWSISSIDKVVTQNDGPRTVLPSQNNRAGNLRSLKLSSNITGLASGIMGLGFVALADSGSASEFAKRRE